MAFGLSPIPETLAWVRPGAQVVCFQRASDGAISNAWRCAIVEVAYGRVEVGVGPGRFYLGDRLDLGDGSAVLTRRTFTPGGPWLLSPLDHPLAEQALATKETP